jgi:hypothetical protein
MVVVVQDGTIVAFAHGSLEQHRFEASGDPDTTRVGLLAARGQEVVEVEAPDELAAVTDGAVLHGHLAELLKEGDAG